MRRRRAVANRSVGGLLSLWQQSPRSGQPTGSLKRNSLLDAYVHPRHRDALRYMCIISQFASMPSSYGLHDSRTGKHLLILNSLWFMTFSFPFPLFLLEREVMLEYPPSMHESFLPFLPSSFSFAVRKLTNLTFVAHALNIMPRFFFRAKSIGYERIVCCTVHRYICSGYRHFLVYRSYPRIACI